MDSQNINIGFIGGGNMARAMVIGLLESGHDPARLYVSDPSTSQRQLIQSLNPELHVSDTNAGVAEDSDILVLAVKPQIAMDVANDIRALRRPENQLIISIMAGITLSALESTLAPTRSVVRIMPNQPALVGAGMSALVATAGTEIAHREQAQYVAEATGRAVWIEDEELMNAVTAISGSGPAYFYLLMEIMENCAVEMGLPKSLAQTLTRQTGLGAGRVAAESQEDLQQIRESVTSKGGTTAAALAVLEQGKIRDIVATALFAARDRSLELGANDSGPEQISDSAPATKKD
jgi:pyrroline-5-carboxylate reductase